MVAYEQAVGEKFALFLFLASAMITRLIVAFIFAWQITLIMLGGVVIIMMIFFVSAKLSNVVDSQVEEKSIIAAAKTEEALSSLQTVKALNG